MSSGGASAGPGPSDKDKDSHWYFSAEQLSNSPSRRQGIDPDAELSYRQMTAYLIQEMGQRLQVSQLCINTAIVYMHRFYAFHSFTHFHRNNIAAASLFLAAKVEEQPRKLEHVIKAANKCLGQSTSSTADAYYIEQAQELVFNENVLLQTLGFDVAIDHPHTHVVKTCHLVKACKDLAQTSYFLASNSLHLTSMCLQYKPTVVACFCIYLACKWSRWEIPQSTEGKHWFHYVDKTVTMDLLKQLTEEFIAIYEKSPSRLKSKLNSIKALAQNASNRVINKEKKGAAEEWKMGDMMKMYAHDGGGSSNSSNSNQPYATTSLSGDSSQQSSALLPPPPPQPQLSRKGDLHSSQHRSHHNSTSHHSKINFPPTDVLDHKSSHKQPPFSGVVSRPRDHSQSSQGHQQAMVPGNSSRSGLPSSSGRSLSSIPGQSVPRQTLQGHQLDVNYHKSRDKSNIVGSYPHNASSQSHAGHKVSQKQDPNRVIQKEQAAGKMPEPGKGASNSSSSSSNKLFPPTSSMATMPQYGSNPSQLQSKLDMGQDMSRNIMHGQRSYGVNNGSGNVPILGSYQPPHVRQSSNSASNNGKHDLSKPASVHLQQHSKQPTIPTESVYNAGTHVDQQTAAHVQSHPNAGYMIPRPPEGSHNEEANSTQLPSVHAMLQQPTNANQTKTSMFSPDWSQQQQQQQTQLMSSNTYVNNNMSTAAVGDAYNYKMPSSKEGGEREKNDRDRMDANATAPKKDRNRAAHPGMDITSSMLMGVRPNTSQTQFHQQLQQQQQQPSLKISMPKKSDSSIIGELTGMTAGIKRPNEGAYKQEEEQNKIRKLDTQPTLSYNESKTGDSNKLHVVNGIETNPDMVRSLLKESLCPSNALLKTEQLGALSLQPPAELFEPSVVSSAPDVTVASAETSLKSTSQSSGTEPSSMEINDAGSNKAEKKKKKDKHKHKEKDKSKDREERKKHKKDKDKHKERDRSELESAGHVKIKISKDKIEGTAECLKIKIPKERIISDVNNSTSSANNSSTDSGSNMHPAPALKIKISKDKLENYATDSSTHTTLQQAQALTQTAAGFYSSFVTPNNATTTTSHSSSGGSSSSGKKKDRDRDKDREREKDKKRASNEGIKSNGSGSFHSAMMLQGGTGGSLLSHPPPTAVVTPKSQNVNKMQLLSNNMNQLFGESNDDDDDDDDYDDNQSVNQKNYKDYHKNRVNNTDSSFAYASTSNNSAGSVRKNTDYGQKYSQSHHMQR
ncbi:cyclin-T isoform X1 [Bactrocera dorsalis]|uniref:Cyclin-T isoform X1 n=1 Tax=Bactrocera dorsalis TaxID=27457 RepID=A0A6I9UVN0_BACDO|nr:cyclin-T isoform X1 [Bactrocera dorsalis]